MFELRQRFNEEQRYLTIDLIVRFNRLYDEFIMSLRHNRLPLTDRLYIYITSTDASIRNTFINIFQQQGFIIKDQFGIKLDITATMNTDRVGFQQYITNLRYSIRLLDRNNNLLQSVNIPASIAHYIQGFGSSPEISIDNAKSMEWFGRKDIEIENLINLLLGFDM
jgi:tetrahydromethanopterin S-methyltransferase subunit F